MTEPHAAAPVPAPSSLHARILADVRGGILAGRWPPGTRIPFEHELAAHYGCSRMTVNKVVSHLARAGLVERRRKAGTFVARPRSESAVLDIHEIAREVADLGLAYEFALLSRRQAVARAADRTRYGMDERTPLLHLACLHRAGDAPFCLERRVINLAAVPEAATVDFSAVTPGGWLMAEVPWTEAEHRIRAEPADAAAVEALRLRPGAPCLIVERRTWSGGRPITAVTLCYPGAAHEVTARFRPDRL